MRKILEKCPSCGQGLPVTQMRCVTCETVISARYDPCFFCKLSPEDSAFLMTFIKNRGNIKEMEGKLTESYWAIRARLNEIIAELGLDSDGLAYLLRKRNQKEGLHRRKRF